jgi:predicted O-linked N-acetylglucosamine transferase (SPINDLY family)
VDLKALFQQALTAHQAGHLAQAEEMYARLLAAHPGHAQVTYLMGALRASQGRSAEAIALLEAALAAQPNNAAILLNLGNALQDQRRFAEAVTRYDQALTHKPHYADALNNRGNALAALGRFDEAVASFDAALAIQPGDANTWYNRGIALQRAHRPEDAIASFDRTLTIRPDLGEAWNNKGGALLALKRAEEALDSFNRALALQPQNLQGLMNRGTALQCLKRHADALADYDRILALAPDFPDAWGEAAKAALFACDWPRMAKVVAEIPAKIAAGAKIDPWVLLSYTSDGALQRAVAARAIHDAMPQRPVPLWRGKKYVHDKIRLAYISYDFRAHPVGYQAAPLLEHHDRSRFEVIGISSSPDDGSETRRRIIAACDQFHQVDYANPQGTAELLRKLEVDIAVELGGLTEGAGLNILAHRPAPVQVSWLGYAGTTGVDFVDAILADAIALPQTQQPFYSEQIAHLPGSFFPMDSKRVIAPPPSRAEMGLPDDAFVFCGFNNNFKITAPVFDIWMRLLQQVPGSVLWLRESVNETLRREAKARGIAPERLVFAAHVPLDVHHARHQLADLFLDTLPYNAHATAADALAAGLPVLTRLGESYPGRVAASLVTAAGLPELVTQSAEDYEALALALARDPARLKALREKLSAGRATAPLFDTARLARDMEAAFVKLLEKA